MSYMQEWQKQQKALKDADRQQKKGAATILNNYRSKQQGAWQRRQRELKEADRKNREKALESLKKYKGGEHDIKEYQRLIAQYRKQLLEQSRSLHAKLAESEPDVPNEMSEEAWREHVEQHIAEFEKMIRDHGFEDLKELDLRTSQRSSVVSYPEIMGSPDARASQYGISDSKAYQEFLAEEQESDSTAKVERNPSGQSTDSPNEIESSNAQSPDPETAGSMESSQKPTAEIQPSSQSISPESIQAAVDEKLPATPSRLDTNGDKGYQTPDAAIRPNTTAQSCPENPSKSEVDHLQSPPRSVSRLIDLDFSFGIIYPSVSPAPTIDACSTAAASIVPVSLEKTLQRTLPTASWDSNLQPVLKSVTLDRQFSSPDSIRYVVRGSVPVHMAINDMPSPMRRQLMEEIMIS